MCVCVCVCVCACVVKSLEWHALDVDDNALCGQTTPRDTMGGRRGRESRRLGVGGGGMSLRDGGRERAFDRCTVRKHLANVHTGPSCLCWLAVDERRKLRQ